MVFVVIQIEYVLDDDFYSEVPLLVLKTFWCCGFRR